MTYTQEKSSTLNIPQDEFTLKVELPLDKNTFKPMNLVTNRTYISRNFADMAEPISFGLFKELYLSHALSQL